MPGLLRLVNAVRCAWVCLITISILAARPCLAADPVSDIEADYDVVFFPAIAHSVSKGKAWELEIRGCVYENEKHRIALGLLHEALALDHISLTKAETQLLNERTRLFMVEHKGGKRIVIQVQGYGFATARTKPNGEFSATVRLSASDVEKLKAPAIEFHALLPAGSEEHTSELQSRLHL